MGNVSIDFDPSDLEGMRNIMAQHGDSEMPFFGHTEDGEKIIISVFKDKIVTETFQRNGWLRKNVYDWDGTREELFQGKWTEPEEQGPESPDPKADYKMGLRDGYRAGFQEAKQEYQHKPRSGPTHDQTMKLR